MPAAFYLVFSSSGPAIYGWVSFTIVPLFALPSNPCPPPCVMPK
ncbi:MAG: hypothetical protein HKP52_02560 [Desulfofustis sp.]|nr:hypothetical protein [Desulfofustis sp.]